MGLSDPKMPKEKETWPAALDALVAASAHHTLLFENEQVRVVRTRIPAGETTAVHTHQWAGVLLVQTWSDIIRRDPDGKVTLDTRQLPLTDEPTPNIPTWQPPLPPHAVENVGTTEFRAIQVEIKDAG
ncbi:MAG TPA: hypothetical protein VHU83_00555 [Bryobacteraceae bacterium]|nr:hypothetical protein [Bryobacteraceae bacterium]